jgi:hypothetical protein
MTDRSQAAALLLVSGESAVEAPVRPERETARPDPDEAALMEAELETDAHSVLRGFRLAIAISLAFWGALAAVIAWLL